MKDITLRLNSKINKVQRSQRRSLKGTRANKFSGLIYTNKDNFPNPAETNLALAMDTTTLKVYVNGKDGWYSVDRFEGTVSDINGKHIIFVQRNILFYSLFYYNEENHKIHLPEYFEIIHSDDIIIDSLAGYNLYACYVEVVK